MKSTGIVRRVDRLGRVVIPMELRKTMDITVGEPLEFFVHQEQIILSPYRPCCLFCENMDELIEFKGKRICRACLNELKKK